MAFFTWIHAGWTSAGDLQPDGSMRNARVTNSNGMTMNDNACFSSFSDFVSYVSSH